MFSDFIKDGYVKEGRPDFELASSLVKIASKRMSNLKKEKITDDNSFQVVENCYEAVKELIDALMAKKGFKSYSHEASVSFLSEFHKEIPFHITNKIDRYRKIRNDIKYRGLITTGTEGRQALKDMKEAFDILLQLLQ